MSEAEILAELSTRTEIIWSDIQWWASVSLAIIAAGYLASDRKVTLAVLVGLLVAYTLYSWMMLLEVNAQAGFIVSAVTAQQVLESHGTIGPIGSYAINELTSETSERRQLVVGFTLWGVYGLTVLFPIYSYWSLRKSGT